MKKFLKILVWVLTVGAIACLWYFTHKEHFEHSLKGLELTLMRENEDGFIVKDAEYQKIMKICDTTNNTDITMIPLDSIRNYIQSIPWAVYTDANITLDEMLVDFDPTEQDFAALSLVAAAYAQATCSDRGAEEIQSAVKEGLLDLTDAYGGVKLALGRYQALEQNTKNEANAYAMGLGSKESWYAAMNQQALGRIELCSALAGFSRLANQFNELTGGWVSRTFAWHREAFEPLFLAEVIPVDGFVAEASEAASEAAFSSSASFCFWISNASFELFISFASV